MPGWAEIGLAVLLGPALWLLGAVFFDFVHFVLHAMLRSRSRLLRALAWPHGVHHRWIDRNLEVQWEVQRRNVLCHIVPEYLTQLVFTGGVALVLPVPFAAVLFALQTAVFVSILRARGLDLNHRPIEMLDAYRPGPWTPPAYHALHHVHPDAYFSAYTKAVDWLVRGAAQLRGRRFALHSAGDGFARALAVELRREGVAELAETGVLDDERLAAADVLVLCDPATQEVPVLERLIELSRTRKLPPEAWVVHTATGDATARHYLDDVRIHYRVLVVPEAGALSQPEAETAARRVVSRIRRGCHVVSTAPPARDLLVRLRFRSTAPARPTAARPVRHRTELVAPSAPA